MCLAHTAPPTRVGSAIHAGCEMMFFFVQVLLDRISAEFFFSKLHTLKCEQLQILSQAAFYYSGEINNLLDSGKNVTSKLLINKSILEVNFRQGHCFIKLCMKLDLRLTAKVL